MNALHLVLALAFLLVHSHAGAWSDKVTYAADVFFSRQSAVLDDTGKVKLQQLAGKIAVRGELDGIVVVGHAGAGEVDAQMLSKRRAEAVKWYLVQLGGPPRRIYIEGKGDTQPVTPDAATNRRAEVESVGSGKDPDSIGVRWMLAWLRDRELRADNMVMGDEWANLSPLDIAPRVEPKLRASFVQRLKLAFIALQDDAGLARLRAMPAAGMADVLPVSSALYAQALGSAYARTAYAQDAARIAQNDPQRFGMARLLLCEEQRRDIVLAAVESITGPGSLQSSPASIQHDLVLCARSLQELSWLRSAGVALHVPRDSDGWSALHIAIDESDTERVRSLLAAGADPNARNRSGDTPLHLVVRGRFRVPVPTVRHDPWDQARKHREIWDALVSAGADTLRTNAADAVPVRPAGVADPVR